MLATKPRPIQNLREVLNEIFTNKNYIMIFLYFQLVNTATVFGAEISTFMLNYDFSINERTYTSIAYCITGIVGSLIIGNLLDKHKAFKVS